MLDYTIFGESHGPAVGVLVTGAAPGLPVDREIIARELERRAPGGPLATARHEPDRLHILSGVYQGFTTGDPICLVLENRDARSGDYEALRNKPRPGHADYASWMRSGGHNDPRGGGLDTLRLQLDDVDRQLVGLLVRRQELSRDIGAYKAAHGLPVRDPEREAQVLRSRGDLAPEHRAEVERLYETLMALSREQQS